MVGAIRSLLWKLKPSARQLFTHPNSEKTGGGLAMLSELAMVAVAGSAAAATFSDSGKFASELPTVEDLDAFSYRNKITQEPNYIPMEERFELWMQKNNISFSDDAEKEQRFKLFKLDTFAELSAAARGGGEAGMQEEEEYLDEATAAVILGTRSESSCFLDFYKEIIEDPIYVTMEERFEAWINEYDVKYSDDAEKEKRFKIFKKTAERIDELNKSKDKTARYGTKQFADKSSEDFESGCCGPYRNLDLANLREQHSCCMEW